MGNAEGAVNRKTSPTPWPLHLHTKKRNLLKNRFFGPERVKDDRGSFNSHAKS